MTTSVTRSYVPGQPPVSAYCRLNIHLCNGKARAWFLTVPCNCICHHQQVTQVTQRKVSAPESKPTRTN